MDPYGSGPRHGSAFDLHSECGSRRKINVDTDLQPCSSLSAKIIYIKLSKYSPIFKKGTKGEPGNYRPVSLTSIPCKIFESILKDSIMDHLQDQKLIKDSQHGFMPGRSCATNLVLFQDKLTKIMDQGKSADIFYLDFAKAFDKVPHKRLVQKLRNKGIGGNILRWIENWLTSRTQAVKAAKIIYIKLSKYSPIFKKGTKGEPGNYRYRPVSLTSILCKIF